MQWYLTAAVVGLAAVSAVLWFVRAGAGGPEPTAPPGAEARQAPRLPLAQVVLFSSGVGYFQREGEVEGHARVDLQFPVGDVNDLLKSMVLQDLGGGKVTHVNYDNQDPIEKTLRSFALDLAGNPTLGQLLNQARGEKLEIAMQQGVANTPAALTGTVVGMESQMQPVGTSGAMHEVHILNLLCAEGLRAVKLADVQRVRFLNPVIDGELKRALEVLATAHDQLKKTVSLGFKGEGKRKVRVGYVVENPIWKTSYRLTMADGKPTLQGWAAIENTTDEDWNGVRVVLVSNRPISFKMDLYPPLYVPRPVVEPDRFASLRPPVYNGAMINAGQFGFQGATNLGIGGGLGGFGGGGLGGFGGNFMMGNSLQNLGMLNNPGMQGQFGFNFNNRYQNSLNPMFVQPMTVPADNNNNVDPSNQPQNPGNRLTFEELQERKKKQQEAKGEANKTGPALANLDPHQSIAAAAAEDLGDAFQYVIEEKVTLPRQKSALLPILDKAVEAKRVSIYNEAVHAKSPLLGLKVKNTSGMALAQGPVTVFDDGYAGDARLPDLQPNEERLLSYAVDQGTEIQTETKFTPGPRVVARAGRDPKEGMAIQMTVRRTRTYVIRNRSPQDRSIVLEHPVSDGWRLPTDAAKPYERSRESYRFEVAAPAGKTVKFDVAEEQPRAEPFAAAAKPSQSPDWQTTAFTSNLGIEVQQSVRTHDEQLLGAWVERGVLVTRQKAHETRSYRVINRAEQDHEVVLEHPVRTDWKLLGEQKPVPGSGHLYRFPLKVASGKAAEQTIDEESEQTRSAPFLTVHDERLRELLANQNVSPGVKEALQKLATVRGSLTETQKQAAETDKKLKAIGEDQVRLRANLAQVPQTSAAYKRYLEKFDKQETEIEALQDTLKQKQEAEKKLQAELEAFGAKLTVK